MDYAGAGLYRGNKIILTGFKDKTKLKMKKKTDNSRESGIELLKIAAIFLIVIHHVIITLRTPNSYVPYQDYLIDLEAASPEFRNIILVLLSHLGAFGNTIFFVCSAWFLQKSMAFNKKKWFSILTEVWTVSVLILLAVLVMRSGHVSWTLMLRSILPTTFANNWYLTCYLLFYPIHGILNGVIEHLSEKQLLRASLALFFLYFCMNSLKGDLFFSSRLIQWVSIYYIVAFLRTCGKPFIESRSKNLIMLAVSLVCNTVLVLLTNAAGLRIGFFSDKTLHWAKNCNPLLLVASIALLNLFRKMHFKNRLINSISGLSLLIYIIHENLLLRTYYRPLWLNWMYERFGYDHVVLLVLALAAAIFAGSLCLASLYRRLIRPTVDRISDWLYEILRVRYVQWERAVLSKYMIKKN